MSSTSTFLAVFTGSKTSARSAAWHALTQAERDAKEQQGVAAWNAWMDRHRDAIVSAGGPLGKTRLIDAQGIRDVTNALCAFTVVRASSHEAAVRMFENHPHYSIFPGDAIEVMPILPPPSP